MFAAWLQTVSAGLGKEAVIEPGTLLTFTEFLLMSFLINFLIGGIESGLD